MQMSKRAAMGLTKLGGLMLMYEPESRRRSRWIGAWEGRSSVQQLAWGSRDGHARNARAVSAKCRCFHGLRGLRSSRGNGSEGERPHNSAGKRRRNAESPKQQTLSCAVGPLPNGCSGDGVDGAEEGRFLILAQARGTPDACPGAPRRLPIPFDGLLEGLGGYGDMVGWAETATGEFFQGCQARVSRTGMVFFWVFAIWKESGRSGSRGNHAGGNRRQGGRGSSFPINNFARSFLNLNHPEAKRRPSRKRKEGATDCCSTAAEKANNATAPHRQISEALTRVLALQFQDNAEPLAPCCPRPLRPPPSHSSTSS